MKIKERIANKIIDWMEENVEGFREINDEAYYLAEQGIADIIQEEINKWLGFDTDFREFENEPDTHSKIMQDIDKTLKPFKDKVKKIGKEFRAEVDKEDD